MAKKKYYQSIKDRVDERKGMEARRMKEDSSLIREDWSAPALLPRNVIERSFAPCYNYMPESAPDLYTAAEKQLSKGAKDFKEAYKLSKP